MLTSSVMPDKWGSMNTNIIMVATPLIRAERLLAVVLNSGLRYAAYTDDKTPIVMMLTAMVLSKKMR